MNGGPFRKVTRLVGKAIGDFNLIEEGDRVLVALSGGKDSWTLLHALSHLRKKAPVGYRIAAAIIHPGTADFDSDLLEDRLRRDETPYQVIRANIAAAVDEKLTPGTNPCAFCSRLRRGILYGYARNEGWNKIALGHHADDFVETLLLNLFFNGSVKAMSPNLLADDGRTVVIRPLVYVPEETTRAYAAEARVPLVECGCSYKKSNGRRDWAKSLIARLKKDVPDIRSNMLSALGRVRYRHLFPAAAVCGDDPADESPVEEESCSPES